jgi:hypothetical protein
VTISDATPGATIYYTEDGTTPTASSTPYTGPISVAATTTIQAIAVASGFTNSAVASATYTIQPGGSGGGALGPYTFIKLVRDPVRPVLYGLDANQGFVVFISEASLSATKQIAVGANATDLSVDPAGAAIYVGNSATTGIGRIDPVTGTFQTLSSPRIAIEVRGMASGTVASVDDGGGGYTSVTLQDGTSGSVLTAMMNGFYQGALATPADGSALFIGESQMMGGSIFRYALQSGSFVETSNSFNVNNGFGFAYSARIVTSAADGSGVYFGGYFINGTDLNQLVYELSDQPLTVTPDARLAISSSNVYAVSSGALLGALPFTSSVQAASADSTTLYLVNGGTISKVDLTAY